MKADAGKTIPELNLYNFEEDEYVESKYVLTSPRSLEACDMLNVKPLELIYKPLSDFQDEMKAKGLTFQDAYTEYDHYEKERQRKLRECRDYRDKMIRDNIFKSSEEVLPMYEPGEVPSAEEYMSARSSRTASSNVDGERARSGQWKDMERSPLTNGKSYNRSSEKLTNGIAGFSHADGKENRANGWRDRPPYSERHLAAHSKERHLEGRQLHSVSTLVGKDTSSLTPPAGQFKSRFMRQRMGLDVNRNESTMDKPSTLSSSLPLHRDEAYQNSYMQHRRSYTADGVTNGLHRTSTPYETSTAVRTRVMDRSFSTISDVHSTNSPRDEGVLDSLPSRRTTSAYSNIERETAALRMLANKFEAGNDFSRSLSLTDLHNPVEGVRHTPVRHRVGRHVRGYSSDDDYTTAYRRRAREADTGGILARALDRRQREIEADLRQEELEYRQQVESLRHDLQDMKISKSRFRAEVDALGEELEAGRWRAPVTHLSPRDRLSPYGRSYEPEETLADRTQRERRVELARQQAVEELETARILSKKSRLQSERVRRAFREALTRNASKWNSTDKHNNDYDPFHHVEERSFSFDRSLNSNDERSYPRPSTHTRSQNMRTEVRLTNGADEGSYERLRGSLRRGETNLTEETLRQHTLLNSQGSSDADRYADLRAAVDDTQERLRSSIGSPRMEGGRVDDLAHNSPRANGRPALANGVSELANGAASDHGEEYIRRPSKPGHHYRKGKVRVKHGDQELVDSTVKEMKMALEERRQKLSERLKMADRQTEELRAARLEMERRERERKQQRANRRAESSKKKQTMISPAANKGGRLVEQVRVRKPATRSHSSRDRDNFDKKVKQAELNNWVNTGHRSQRARSRSANRNRSQFTLA